MLEGVLNTLVFRLQLVMFCVIITNVWWDISNSSWLENNLPSFEHFRKIALATSLGKARRARNSSPSSLLIQYNTHISWKTTSTIQTNGDHHHFFILIPILMLGHVLVHSVDNIHALVVTVKLIWLLFLNILPFNFVPMPNKSVMLTRFRRSYVNRLVVVLTNHCWNYSAFLLDVHCSKWPRSFFCSCLSPMVVHLCNLFLLSKSVARMLLTPRWVSRQKGLNSHR